MPHSNLVIFAGAHIDDYRWHRQTICNDDYIICADSGARHAKEMGIMPNIIIGDFDSIDPELLKFYQENKCEIIHDDDQNATDLMKAIALTKPNSHIDIFGAIGQRADHDFSNYLILKNLDNPNHIALRSQYETRRVVKSSFTLEGNKGDKIGLFPLSPVTNFHTQGLKYDPSVLGGAYDFGWNGACNEMIESRASVKFSSGCVLITHTNAS